ncbi:helix-turn-helix transcriptional regulator [Nocardioides daejeonensis]|uniref:helix-turn-helix transcriptional regulator n=1 Tax=Nocardioides daejeonensis TaxID=1046556 RepID=UPI000D7462FB|nr:LuxR C-terminal-related transcriptional regulator [Nocardioides daejeonensis]
MMSEGAITRAVVFDGPRRRPVRTAGHSFRTRATDLVAEAGEVLGLSVASPDHDPTPALGAAALAMVADDCVDRARMVGVFDEGAARRLYELAITIQMLALEVQEEQLAVRGRRLAGAADGLSRLRGAHSIDALMNAVCEEITRSCDFGRVVISRVEAGSWLPARAHFAGADESWFADWVGAGIPLRGNTPETRLLTERAPAAVYDTASTTVHREIIVDSGHSTSYVVAPLVSAGTVVGFLHADHFPTARHVEESDGDLLGTVADGIVRLLGRLEQIERLRTQRDQVRGALASLDGIEAEPMPAATRVVARPELVAELTGRELEVLDMIVQGATNRDIGERLVIAEDTVKSHVKQILRKLGVANRAQAIACAAGTAPAPYPGWTS